MPTLDKSAPPTITQDLVRRSVRGLMTRHAVPVEDIERASHDVAAVFVSGMDGYALARALEIQKGWTCLNTQTVIDLDSLDAIVHIELEIERRRWVKNNGIQPPYVIGTELVEGQIVGLDPFDPSTYVVRPAGDCPPHHRVSVRFENARLANMAGAA